MIRQLLALSGPTLLLAAGLFVRAEAQEPAAPSRNDASRADDRSAEPAVTTSPNKPPVEEIAPANAADSAAADSPAAPPRNTRFRTVDRLDLDASAITGNQELPKVLYIVPWKKSDIGDLTGKPANSLLDEVLTPVDRDVFRRQTEYFSRLEGGTAASQSAPGSGQQQPGQQGQPDRQGNEQGQGQPPPEQK